MAGSFHPARRTRLGLAHRRTQRTQAIRVRGFGQIPSGHSFDSVNVHLIFGAISRQSIFRYYGPTYEELLLENRRLRERLTELDQIAQTARQVAHGLNVELDKAKKDSARQQAIIDRIRQQDPQIDPLDARTDPSATAINGVVAAVKENPSGDQDLVMLTIPQDAELDQGTEFVIYRGNQYICKVRVERRMNDMVACRVITDSWNASERRIQPGDLATTRLF